MPPVFTRRDPDITGKCCSKATLMFIAHTFGNLGNREIGLSQKLLSLAHPSLQAEVGHRYTEGFLEDRLEFILIGADVACQVGKQRWFAVTALQLLHCGMCQFDVA